ncbi:hypothetical protein WH95_18330 [Kiloniella litopenaei]|uniref:YozE SAM-like domain-containing protein n=1 Tax=Kiloniella litopenaei TaxID=1549748 RepID=A0A0M2R4N4_9PROT|nr:hypothetical protein [Kiloniella litopenaei]KKJ75404.1 hypothetical protein WH95_18330 [Kiloniella litopenaei]
MSAGDFKSFLKEKTVLPKDAAGWIDLFLADLNVPDISNFNELKIYLDKHVEGPDKKERLKSVPHYWEEYEKSLKEKDVQ